MAPQKGIYHVYIHTMYVAVWTGQNVKQLDFETATWASEWKSLLDVLKSGDVEAIKAEVKPESLAATDEQGYTLLHRAAAACSGEVITGVFIAQVRGQGAAAFRPKSHYNLHLSADRDRCEREGCQPFRANAAVRG